MGRGEPGGDMHAARFVAPRARPATASAHGQPATRRTADGRNVAFGRVIAGMDVIRALGSAFSGAFAVSTGGGCGGSVAGGKWGDVVSPSSRIAGAAGTRARAIRMTC